MILKKNKPGTAPTNIDQILLFLAWNNAALPGVPYTGLSIYARVYLDGVFSVVVAMVEVDAVNAPGVYKLVITSGTYTNGSIVAVKPYCTVDGNLVLTPETVSFRTGPDWKYEFGGSDFDSSTDNLVAIRTALEDSIVGVVRS